MNSCYHWSNRYNTKKFELDFYDENKKYAIKVASYSLNTKRLILTCPDINIPEKHILEDFVALCENYKFDKENKDE